MQRHLECLHGLVQYVSHTSRLLCTNGAAVCVAQLVHCHQRPYNDNFLLKTGLQ